MFLPPALENQIFANMHLYQWKVVINRLNAKLLSGDHLNQPCVNSFKDKFNNMKEVSHYRFNVTLSVFKFFVRDQTVFVII